MKRFYLAAALVALSLTLSPVASAAVIGSATLVPGFNAPDAGLAGQGFSAWQLSVSTDAVDDVISAVDVYFGGDLHQRWGPDNDFNGFPDPTPVGPPANGRGDSHLTPIAGALVGAAPTEDNSGAGSPLADTATFDYGLGTFLRGAWGIPGNLQTAAADLAYIVIPDGSGVDMDIRVEVATRSSGTVSLVTPDFFVPEPASLALAGFGLASVIMMRRRG